MTDVKFSKIKQIHATKKKEEKSAQLIQHNRNQQITNRSEKKTHTKKDYLFSFSLLIDLNLSTISFAQFSLANYIELIIKFYSKKKKCKKTQRTMVEKPDERLLPTNKVRTIMKSCGDPSAFLSKESVLVVTKAAVSLFYTEFFQHLCNAMKCNSKNS